MSYPRRQRSFWARIKLSVYMPLPWSFLKRLAYYLSLDKYILNWQVRLNSRFSFSILSASVFPLPQRTIQSFLFFLIQAFRSMRASFHYKWITLNRILIKSCYFKDLSPRKFCFLVESLAPSIAADFSRAPFLGAAERNLHITSSSASSFRTFFVVLSF